MGLFNDVNIEKEQIKNIEYVSNLYKVQENKVKSEEFVRDLLFKEYVRTVKQNLSRYDLVNMFREAASEIGKKYKKERSHLEELQSWMREDFLNDDKKFKIKSIIECGLDGYAWDIEFEGHKTQLRIVVPIMANLTTENFKYANKGMFTCSIKKSEAHWTQLKASYSIKEISNYIRDYFSWTDGEEM